jgi:hypothetical protein
MNYFNNLAGDAERAQLQLLEEERSWRSRDVRYVAGSWPSIRDHLPQFEIRDFDVEGGPANPYYHSVVRLPLRAAESAIPVGLVSRNYRLLQHRELGDFCIEALNGHGFPAEALKCELGMTELGEWMNLRFELPDAFSFIPPDGHPLALRLEVFNSVDGTSKLIALMTWFRLVCSNGLVVRQTMQELSDRHDRHLDLQCIRDVSQNGLAQAREDQSSLRKWATMRVTENQLIKWVDKKLTDWWGIKAAARVLHICRKGTDVSLAPPFETCQTSEKNVAVTGPIPGAAVPARNLYDISQALSWVASHRKNAEERIAWQADIPELIELLRSGKSK